MKNTFHNNKSQHFSNLDIDMKSSSPDKSWLTILSFLNFFLDRTTIEKWISPIKVKYISDSSISLIFPNMVFYQKVLDDYLPFIEKAKEKAGLFNLSLHLEVVPSTEESFFSSNDFLLENSPEPDDCGVPVEYEADVSSLSPSEFSFDSRSEASGSSNLNSSYSFETFVKGESNKFALASAFSVADSPGKTYNPLFIYGSTGLGKTHLLHAVGSKILSNNPRASVVYISSERFMNEMISCIRFKKMWDFRKKYRNCDVFLVDDIQFISRKEQTQVEFFHTFNTLYENKKQIVITSDLFPQDIPDIEERLRNRFQWGLIADIQPPSIEHRIAILLKKASLLNLQLSEEVAFYIANHAKKNVRELEGALHRIAAFSVLHGRKIDLNLASETFHNVLSDVPKRPTIDLIQKIVAEHFKLRPSDLKSKKRHRALTVPRQIAMFLSRSRTSSSFPEIGAKFGGKDHTTVMHAVKKVEQERIDDLEIKNLIESLERKLDQQC